MLCHRRVIAGSILVGVSLLSLPAVAQQAGPQSQQGIVSDDDFLRLHEQIKELTNPTFRALLRIRLLSWKSPEPGPTRQQAEVEVAAQGLTDLCEHQDEIWSPTATWLHEGLVRQIKSIQSPGVTPIEICILKTEIKSSPEKDLASGIKKLSDPETSAVGLDLAKSAILTGQVSAGAILGHLLALNAKHSPYLHDLLSATLLVEEKQPGTLPLRMMPFFSSVFLEKSVPAEIATRYVFVAVRSSRLPAEEQANPIARSLVSTLLNSIVSPAKRLTPAVYPEIASRLSSLNGTGPEMRLAAEERIKNASDQLEQLIAEANSASDEQQKRHFFFQAARLAKEQGQLSKAVDLAVKAVTDRELTNERDTPSWMNDFLLEIVTLAIKQKTPREATYAISKMRQHLGRARAFRLLGEYYGADQEKVKSKEAFIQSSKELKLANNSNEKVRASLLLAESVLKYEPADAYEVFRESVKAINNLASPEKDKEKMYYLHLLPVAEELIRSFRILAARENQTATSLAAEIKLSELRLSALAGAYSSLH